MPISRKLIVSFSVLMVIIFSISTYSYVKLSNVSHTYEDMIHIELEGMYSTAELQQKVAMGGIHLRQYVLEPNEQTLKAFEESQKTVDQAIELLLEQATTDEVRQKISSLAVQQDKISEIKENIKREVANGQQARAIELISTEIKEANTELVAMAQNILDVVKERFNSTAQNTNNQVKDVLLFLATMSLVGMAVAIGITLRLHKTIAKPLQQLAKAAERITAGDLTDPDIPVKSKDEVGQLSGSFNKMKQELEKIIGVCQTNALDLSAMSQQLTASTNQVAYSSGEIAENIERIVEGAGAAATISSQTSAAMAQSAEGVQTIVHSAQSMHEQIKETSELATRGSQYLERAKGQIETIYQSAKGTAAFVESLSEQSQTIQKMTHMITEIANQTNLLALNAAIEAARAGEAGKGFAIVADEVRKLAEQSQQSASMIIELTTGTIQQTNAVEEAMKVGLQDVQEGVKIIDDSEAMFTQIVSSFEHIVTEIAKVSHMTEQVSATTEQVSTASIEVSAGMQDLAGSTENVSQQVEEQSAIIQEINAVSETLTTCSTTLAETIAQFHLSKS